MQTESERHALKLEAERKERELHTKARSQVIVKYFSEKVSPAIHGAAAVQEAFTIWKEETVRSFLTNWQRDNRAKEEKVAQGEMQVMQKL
jgi:hypothetical protein